MLLNYDFLEFENDKKVRVIDDKLHVNILGLSQRLDLLKDPLQRILLMKNRKRL